MQVIMKGFVNCLAARPGSEDTIVLSCEWTEQTMPVGGSQLAVAVLGSNKQSLVRGNRNTIW